MPSPQLVNPIVSSQHRHSPKRRRHLRKLPAANVRLRNLGWETGGRVVVNLVLGVIAVGALVRLLPYYQEQRQALQETEASVEVAEKQLKSLRSDFSRYFDPAQGNHAALESLSGDSEHHVPVVLVNPLVQDAEN